MFEQFPKTRPPLPAVVSEIFLRHYRSNRKGETPASYLAQRMESWLHRQVARDLPRSDGAVSTLEIGAGTLNHLRYEPDSNPYDVVEPFSELYQGSTQLARVRNVYADVSDIPAESSYERIVSIAAFEHICDLPRVVASCGLLLNPNGCLRVAIPSEGTILWGLGWRMTTGLEFKLKHGLDYGIVMRHEHVNDAIEVEDVLRFFFKQTHSRVLGLTKRFSLYQFYECTGPDVARCTQYSKPAAC